MRIARSGALSFRIEASMPMSSARLSTMPATRHSQASQVASSAARSATRNWMPWNSSTRRLNWRRSLM
ncbi:hypothetical protein G6F57_023876 [Rhizopus arrhizus]|nr:hypothetical protein G6F57_023876 [Rhizopus arrhizus]